VLIGALVTAILFHAGRWAIGLYLGRATQPTAYGAAASFAALLLWLYYSAQIFLFGAEFTWVYAHTHGSRSNVDPEAAARAGSTPTSRDPAAALTRSRTALEAAMQARRRRR
jgi:membrane protein